MKKIIYLIAIVTSITLFSCQEAKNDAAQVEEGMKEAGEELTDEPVKKVGEGFKEAGEDLTNEPIKQLEEGFEDAGNDIEEETEDVIK